MPRGSDELQIICWHIFAHDIVTFLVNRSKLAMSPPIASFPCMLVVIVADWTALYNQLLLETNCFHGNICRERSYSTNLRKGLAMSGPRLAKRSRFDNGDAQPLARTGDPDVD